MTDLGPGPSSGHPPARGAEGRPDLSTDAGRLAFIRVLNSRLPTKRTIAQGLLRNEHGEILLCQLTYKQEWDLPGGVVDPGESPAACVEREVHEELGLSVRAGRLLAVNWLPPYRGWDDATLHVFDLGTIPTDALEPARFLAREIRGAHWCSVADAATHVAAYVMRMLTSIEGADGTCYLEDGKPRADTQP